MKQNQSIAVLFTRLLLGIIFFMQGYGKIFKWGVDKVFNMDFFYPTYKDLLPGFIIRVTAYYTSYVELIGGFLLILGYKRDWALYGLASVLIIVSFGHGLAEPIWDMTHVIFRAMLLISLLIIPKDWDRYSLDAGLIKRNTQKSK
jgi:putative oxidoreductase